MVGFCTGQAFPSRIIVVSSILHKKGRLDLNDLHFTKGRLWSVSRGYNQSKLANILFAKELARRYAQAIAVLQSAECLS
jgi:NAD(P)-dependent dehydrogenase (short-subunit alcohol dehydrogenase family)